MAVSDAVCASQCIMCPLLCQAKSSPAQDQLVYVAAEFAATLFPEDKMFTLGSDGEPNDNPIYTNPTLSYSTAYTYFVICLPDTTPDSLNVCVFSHTICARTALGCWYCLFHRTQLVSE